MLIMKEQRAFNSTVEKKSMFLESTKLHYRPTKIEKRLLCYKLVQMGSRQYSVDTVHMCGRNKLLASFKLTLCSMALAIGI